MANLAFPLLWAIAVIAAYWYAQDREIPWPIALAALPAFLLEISFYFVLGTERLRGRLERLPPAARAGILTAAAVVPYCVASLALGSFDWPSLGILAALAAAASFWFVVLTQSPLTDVFFLVAIAAVWLFKILPTLYVDPHPRLPLAVLGQLMWFRTGMFAMVSVRRAPGVGFGFWPQAREWKIGALYFAGLLPVAAALGWALKFTEPHMRYQGWERITLLAAGTFFGTLWVLALGEEFFFRGLLQQWMTTWLKNEWAALVATAAVFGSVHLWYRTFPNWRFAALAAVAGVFYGMAFRQARSIRASMVTHALTVTTWRMFFS